MSSTIPLTTVYSYFLEAQRSGVQEYIFQFNNVLTMLQYRKAYEVALRYLAPEKKVLDWGCGNGHFSYFLTLQNIATTGFSFDSLPVFLEKVSLFHFVKGSPEEPTQLPFAQSTFDIVFSVGVLEHVHETGGSEEKSLDEIRRILKPGGLFICYHFPNKFQWVEYVGRFLGLAEYFHRRKYSQRGTKKLVHRAGFTIEEIGRYNFFPRNQLHRLPAVFKNSRLFIQVFEWIDRLLSLGAPLFCTNHYFVARVMK
jgi:SAM-dependent methyltransferase